MTLATETRSRGSRDETMNADFWLELLIVVLRIVSAGLSD